MTKQFNTNPYKPKTLNPQLFASMAINEKFTARVRQALASQANVEEKKMFRGIAFMLNDKLCISVGDDRLMLRIDPSLHDEALQSGASTVIMKGRECKGYVYVKEDAVQRKKDFDYWINLALSFNPKAKASKKKGGT
jgi:TfoX/Sxy family transcriptional regulator of competence genes